MTPETTASGTTGWTVESVLVHLNNVVRDLKERFIEALIEQKDWFRNVLVALEKNFVEALAALDKRIQQQFSDSDKAIKAAMAAAEKAGEKAELNSEKWRANANEWRQAMNDREKSFAPIAQLRALEKTQTEMEARLMQQISNLRESRSSSEGAIKSTDKTIAYTFGFVGTTVGVVTIILKLVTGH